MLRLVLLALILLAHCLPASATEGDSTRSMTAEEFEATLHYRDGLVELPDGLATIRLTPEFRFLGPEDAASVIVNAWGNPPGSAEGILGMICLAATGVTGDSNWAVIVTNETDGYVSDEGAEKINYDKMLKEMKESQGDINKERIKNGYSKIELVGWAEPPHYDRFSHKLYWAKELHFGEAESNTLNYAIRVLGRRGVLVLNAVASMAQLPQIREGMPSVLPMVEFNEGHRYGDFVKGQDKMAEYGLAALVTGTAVVAAKAGLFKGLLVALLAFKKLIVVGVVGLGAFLAKLFKRKPVDGPIQERPSSTDSLT